MRLLIPYCLTVTFDSCGGRALVNVVGENSMALRPLDCERAHFSVSGQWCRVLLFPFDGNDEADDLALLDT